MDGRMVQNIRELLKDLDRYIQENWIAPLDEESAGAEASVREEQSIDSGLQKRKSLSGLPRFPKKDGLAESGYDERLYHEWSESGLEDEDDDAFHGEFTSGSGGRYQRKKESESSYDFFAKGSADLERSVSSLRLDALLGEVGETFHEVLFQRIARSGMSDVEVYKRANIDRKLFSKIRANPAYHPRKNTVLALAIALRMNLEETQDLLSRAEYALSPSSKADVIIRYFIEHRMYDIDLINIVLYDYGLAVLG